MKKVIKQFKLPFKSTSPKLKKFPAHKESLTFLKKKSSIKSPQKIRGHTQTGQLIIPKQNSTLNVHKKPKDKKQSKMTT